jgi:hypothetical protein
MPHRIRPLHRTDALQERDGFGDVIFKMEWPTLNASAKPTFIRLEPFDNRKQNLQPEWVHIGRHPLDLRRQVPQDGFTLLGLLYEVGPVREMLGAYGGTELYKRNYATYYVPRERTQSRRPEIIFMLLGRTHAMHADFRASAAPLFSERKPPKWAPNLS